MDITKRHCLPNTHLVQLSREPSSFICLAITLSFKMLLLAAQVLKLVLQCPQVS